MAFPESGVLLKERNLFMSIQHAKALHEDMEAREDLDEVKFFSVDEIKELETVSSVEWVFRELGLWD